MSIVRFFWIGEESEIFVAESFQQILDDCGQCGTGIESVFDGVPLDYADDPIEWGEFDGTETRMTIRDCDEDERWLNTLTGNLHDIYTWTDGGRFGLPVMLTTQYG